MVHIRSYKPSDYPAVKHILQEADMFNDSWDSEVNLAEMIAADAETVLVAEMDGVIVGSVYVIRFGSNVAYIFRLAVKKEQRDKGIGSKLLEEVQKRFSAKGFREFGMFVTANETKLHEFYNKRGYHTSGRQFVYMWKELH